MIRDCPFCTEFSDKKSPNTTSRLIDEREGLLLIPTLGCFRKGYCLCIPEVHTYSFATCTEEELNTASLYLQEVRRIIAKEFGEQVIFAEHGPNPCEAVERNPDCSCVDHAHMHLIPVPDVGSVVEQFVEAGGPPMALDSLSELSQFEGPYIYLSIPSISSSDSYHMIWDETHGFRRQFVRIVCADLYGIKSFYNWRTYPFRQKMRATRRRLLPHFSRANRELGERTPSALDTDPPLVDAEIQHI